MGDPMGPWQDYGDAQRWARGTRPNAPAASPWPAPWPPPAGETVRDDGYGSDRRTDEAYVNDGYTDGAYGDDGYGDEAYDDDYGDDGYGDDGYELRPHGDRTGRAGGVAAAVRSARSEAAWRYSSAPLWARITVDMVAAATALGLIAGLLLILRPDDSTEQAGAREPVVVATVPSSTSTTTTTVATTTTTASTTTTTAPPTTTTAPPPTSPPEIPPPTSAPTTTEPRRVHYDNCFEAFLDDALPLFRGDPGYDRDLDRDGDGEACEFGE